MTLEEIERLPKVELHLHLDGSVNPKLLNEYANSDVTNEVIAPAHCLDLKDYLNRFSLPVSYLQNKTNLENACAKLITDLKKDNVIYAEVRFSPLKLITDNLTLDDIIITIRDTFRKGDIPINLILCMMRNDSYNDNLKVIELAKKYLNDGVCAIDLAGDEANYPTSLFNNLFQIARKENIPFTIHAGEVNNYNTLLDAIKLLPSRIGHGICCSKHKDLLDAIKNNNILLELCPTSNVQTNAITSYDKHPIKMLAENNILISINTDNRTVSNITLTEEYYKLVSTFNFTKDDFYKWNLNAINYSFASIPLKEKLKKKLNENYK